MAAAMRQVRPDWRTPKTKWLYRRGMPSMAGSLQKPCRGRAGRSARAARGLNGECRLAAPAQPHRLLDQRSDSRRMRAPAHRDQRNLAPDFRLDQRTGDDTWMVDTQ